MDLLLILPNYININVIENTIHFLLIGSISRIIIENETYIKNNNNSEILMYNYKKNNNQIIRIIYNYWHTSRKTTKIQNSIYTKQYYQIRNGWQLYRDNPVHMGINPYDWDCVI